MCVALQYVLSQKDAVVQEWRWSTHHKLSYKAKVTVKEGISVFKQVYSSFANFYDDGQSQKHIEEFSSLDLVVFLCRSSRRRMVQLRP